MSSEDPGSVTQWISSLKTGADDSVERLWKRYSKRMIGLARERLRSVPRTAADEEDVALSAFDSFCARAARGQFPEVEDRDDLWRLVAMITARKAVDLVQHERRQKRGGGVLVLDESALDDTDYQKGANGLGQIAGRDPTPEFAALMAEECRRMLDGLGDETLRNVALWKMDGYTDDEIAGHLDCSRRTVVRKLELIREMWAGERP
jgi:DNA-directed RNA polymerase specialized sigma24 family protein